MGSFKAAVVSFAVLLLVSGCGYSQSNLNEEYREGYETGYEEGYETGREEGWDDAFEYLEEEGVIEKKPFVFLSNDGSDTYHSRYCELADWDNELPLEVVERWGWSPCDICGGHPEEVYTNPDGWE